MIKPGVWEEKKLIADVLRPSKIFSQIIVLYGGC